MKMRKYLIMSDFAVRDIDDSVHYLSDPGFVTDDWQKYDLDSMYEIWSVYEINENGCIKFLKSNF